MKRLLDQIIFLKDHILYAVFEEGGIIFNLKDRGSLTVNSTGAEILDLLDGKRKVNELTRLLSGRYQEQAKIIEKDVTTFLNELMERGWVHVK